MLPPTFWRGLGRRDKHRPSSTPQGQPRMPLMLLRRHSRDVADASCCRLFLVGSTKSLRSRLWTDSSVRRACQFRTGAPATAATLVRRRHCRAIYGDPQTPCGLVLRIGAVARAPVVSTVACGQFVRFCQCARSSTDRASDYGSEGWGFESLRAHIRKDSLTKRLLVSGDLFLTRMAGILVLWSDVDAVDLK